MPIDTSIYQGLIQPPKSLIGYTNDLDQADLAQTNLAQQKLNLIGAQRTDADQQALRKLYSTPGFDPTKTENLPQIFAISPQAGTAAQKSALEAQKTQADIGHVNAQAEQSLAMAQKLKTEHAIAVQAQIAQAAGAATDQASWDRGLQVAAALGADVSSVPKQFDPVIAKQLHDQALTGAQQLDAHYKQMQAEETARHDKVGEGIQIRGQNMVDSRAKDQIKKDYIVAGLDANGNDTQGDGGLSPAAVENAAARYNLDGTMPTNVGRGAQGARDLRKIQNRAAELALGTDPTQLRINQMDAKSAGSALTQTTKAHTMAGSFEQTANMNADLALSLSKKNDRTGIPLLNAGLQAWRVGTGSEDALKFADANETFVNEYAKIMSGGTGNGPTSDSARAHAHDLLSTKYTPEQYEGAVRLLQQEMKNRMKSYEDAETGLKARLAGKASPAPAGAGGGLPSADAIAAELARRAGK